MILLTLVFIIMSFIVIGQVILMPIIWFIMAIYSEIQEAKKKGKNNGRK